MSTVVIFALRRDALFAKQTWTLIVLPKPAGHCNESVQLNDSPSKKERETDVSDDARPQIHATFGARRVGSYRGSADFGCLSTSGC